MSLSWDRGQIEHYYRLVNSIQTELSDRSTVPVMYRRMAISVKYWLFVDTVGLVDWFSEKLEECEYISVRSFDDPMNSTQLVNVSKDLKEAVSIRSNEPRSSHLTVQVSSDDVAGETNYEQDYLVCQLFLNLVRKFEDTFSIGRGLVQSVHCQVEDYSKESSLWVDQYGGMSGRITGYFNRRVLQRNAVFNNMFRKAILLRGYHQRTLRELAALDQVLSFTKSFSGTAADATRTLAPLTGRYNQLASEMEMVLEQYQELEALYREIYGGFYNLPDFATYTEPIPEE